MNDSKVIELLMATYLAELETRLKEEWKTKLSTP